MDMSLTQQYLLCTFDEDGRLEDLDARGTLLAVALYELVEDGFAEIKEDDKVRVIAALPEDKHYLLPLYNFIEGRREVSLDTLGKEFLGHGDEHQIFMAALCQPMREAHLLTGHDGAWKVNLEARKDLLHKEVEAMKGDVPMTRDEAALMIFLLGAGQADALFGREERRILDEELGHGKSGESHASSETLRSVKADIDKHFAPIVVAYKASH